MDFFLAFAFSFALIYNIVRDLIKQK